MQPRTSKLSRIPYPRYLRKPDGATETRNPRNYPEGTARWPRLARLRQAQNHDRVVALRLVGAVVVTRRHRDQLPAINFVRD